MLHGDLGQFKEQAAQAQLATQNSKLLKASLNYGPIMARTGSMVAYQGEARFTHAGSGGVAKWMKKKVSGEGMPLMSIEGTGEVFLAFEAQDVHVFYLENDFITANGLNLLAFSASLEWDIVSERSAGGMLAGGMWNMALKGTGYVAAITKGTPVLLDVTEAPTYADPQASVMWSSGVQTSIKTDIDLKTLFGRGSGESFQIAFSGQGWVMIQPAESQPPTAQQPTTGGQGLMGSMLGGIK